MYIQALRDEISSLKQEMGSIRCCARNSKEISTIVTVNELYDDFQNARKRKVNHEDFGLALKDTASTADVQQAMLGKCGHQCVPAGAEDFHKYDHCPQGERRRYPAGSL